MSLNVDLKQIERNAFRSTHRDGLMDIYLGLVTITMALFMYRPAEGYSITNILIFLLCYGFASGLYWAGKKFITTPRMGQVKFGETRKKRNRMKAVLLGILILLQFGVVILTALGWLTPQLAFLGGNENMDFLVALIGSLFVLCGMGLLTIFQDFTRGYYITCLMALAVFLMVLLNRPLYPILLSMLIILPGLFVFIRFIRRYPLPINGVQHE